MADYLSRVYFGLALDPIHVGTGGYRLGQVDQTIVREPGTDLPKIPGSSLEGTCRAYTAIATNRYRNRRVYDHDSQQTIEYVSCAGKGGQDGSEHCGQIDCPVCVTYGFSIGRENRSFHGLAQFYDAQLLFFPVSSIYGPVWVTWPDALKQAGYELNPDQFPEDQNTVTVVSGLSTTNQHINLGWIDLEINDNTFDMNNLFTDLRLPSSFNPIKNRLVLVSDGMASVIVNNNLEVRTSVAIDPATGAAKKNALYTYEAIPRSSVLSISMSYLNPQHFELPGGGLFSEDKTCEWVEEQALKGFNLMKYLGIGGMNTRGFGRFEIFRQ